LTEWEKEDILLALFIFAILIASVALPIIASLMSTSYESMNEKATKLTPIAVPPGVILLIPSEDQTKDNTVTNTTNNTTSEN
jgi:hypothetical protein